MGDARRWSVYVVAAGLTLTGAGWLTVHYFLQRRGPFGPEANPWEPWWLKAHGALAFAALWLGGLVWGVHVRAGWSARRRRWSGGIVLGVLLMLIVSGYLLSYAGDDQLRGWVSRAHWIVGLAAPGTFLVHRFAGEAGRQPGASSTGSTRK
jgi:hypothetical protein